MIVDLQCTQCIIFGFICAHFLLSVYRNMSTQTTRMSDSMEFNMIPILVALILVVFTYVLLKQLFGKAKGNAVIMVGIEGSGELI